MNQKELTYGGIICYKAIKFGIKTLNMLPQLAIACATFAASSLIKKYIHLYFANLPHDRARSWQDFITDKSLYFLGSSTAIIEKLIYSACLAPFLTPLIGSFWAYLIIYSVPSVITNYLFYKPTMHNALLHPKHREDMPFYLFIDITSNALFYSSFIAGAISPLFSIVVMLFAHAIIGSNNYMELHISRESIFSTLLLCVSTLVVRYDIGNTIAPQLCEFIAKFNMNSLNDITIALVADSFHNIAPHMI